MGTACAPSYTNIFMARFEEKHIYPLTKDRVEQYLRYTDDFFFIWKEVEKKRKLSLIKSIKSILPLNLI